MTLDFKNVPFKTPSQNLVSYTESLTDWYTSKLSNEDRKLKGQYFTPGTISELMVKQFQNFSEYKSIKILDPGAGLGIFESTICDYLKSLNKDIKIHFDMYESDINLIPLIELNLETCKKDMDEQGLEISYRIISEDFLLSNSHICFNSETVFGEITEKYDLVISNPPYYKISTNSPQVQYMKHIMNGQPNIYPCFMALSAKLLKQEGQITLLTPRSYCSGLYFKKFRNWFFEIIKPSKIHLFESRKAIFKKDKVYQENMILTGVKTKNAPKNIQLSISRGIPLTDEDVKKRETAYNNIVYKKKVDTIIRIPTSEVDEHIATHIDKFKDNLDSLGFKVSTGRVVPFRAKKFLDYDLTSSEESVPLIWMQNIINSDVTWPIDIANKPIKIKVTSESQKILIPNEDYIFFKRLSSKEGKRHIDAAAYFKNYFDVKFIGVENHVNYISKKRGKLTKSEAYGIVALLNSIVYNKYFLLGNGTTQINAKEINNLPLPPINLITDLGDSIIELKRNKGKIESSVLEEMITIILNLEKKISRDLVNN